MTFKLDRGIAAALVAALLFGAGTPLATLLREHTSPWLLAALLYLGSGLGLWPLRTQPAQPSSLPRCASSTQALSPARRNESTLRVIGINAPQAWALARPRSAVRLMGMRTCSSTRQRVSRWMIGVLLLAQWLTSAYACPRADAQAAREQGAAQVTHAMTADCQGMTASVMDPANPALCKAHCDADKQAPVVKVQGDIPSAALAWSIVASPALHDVLPAPMHARGEVLCAGPPGWPPLYLIHQVLRN